MPRRTFYWYDFETFGIDPKRDRPAQFAGIRTDEELNIVGESTVLFCKPANDFLPNPDSCLITGITPQKATKEGLCEARFIARINDEFSYPNTCVAGYNSIRFDDEFTRNTLYRNFYDPYAREWQNGNSRWDIIDMVRLACALRPEGINWPSGEEGKTSFRLDRLTVANGIEHEHAHDALADVYATIEMAKLIRSRQSKLFDFVFSNRGKASVAQLLDVHGMKPVLHISGMYRVEKYCLAVVAPLANHPRNKNGIIVFDLSEDPGPLLDLSVEEIRHRLFTPREALPEGIDRVPLKTVHLNRCPVLIPVKTLRKDDAIRLKVDLDVCRKNYQQIRKANGLAKKVEEVFSESVASPDGDPDYALYSGGFFSDDDKSVMERIRSMPPEALSDFEPKFQDNRLSEMLFRYRARNFPESLNDKERRRWDSFRINRVTDKRFGASIVIDGYREKLKDLRGSASSQEIQDIVDQLEEYGDFVLES